MLQQTNINIPFNRGLDTKTDAKLLNAPVLRDLQNGVFTKGGSIRKRKGMSQLPLATFDGATTNNDGISNGVALGTFKDELLMFDDAKCYSYSGNNEAWIERGTATSYASSVKQVIRNSYQQTFPDMAISGDIAVYAWEDSRGGVRAKLVDLSTGVVLLDDYEINDEAFLPRCFKIGQYLFVSYIHFDGVDTCLKVRRINPAFPSAFDAASTIVTNVSAAYLYDVCDYNDSLSCFVYARAGSTLGMGYITRDGLLGTALNSAGVDAIALSDQPYKAISLTYDSVNGYFYVAYSGGSPYDIRVLARNTALVSVFSDTSVGSAQYLGVSWEPRNITGVAIGNTFHVFWDSTEDTTRRQTWHNSISSTGVAGTAASLCKQGGLVSKAWAQNDIACVLLGFESDTQGTYFLFSSDGTLLGKHYALVAGDLVFRDGLSTNGCGLPNVVAYGDDYFMVPLTEKGKFRSELGYFFTLTGISCLNLDYSQNSRFSSAVLGENLHITGGLLRSYDGVRLVEHGFMLFPIFNPLSPETGGYLGTGTYLYRAVYSWTDAQGQLHRSAPSATSTITFGSGTTNAVDMAFLSFFLTEKTDVMIDIYRTTADGTIFYKITNVLDLVRNDITSEQPWIFYTDVYADEDITANEILYTQGGELENDAPPGASIIATSKNRIYTVDERGALWFSKERVSGEGVAFSAFLQKTIPPDGGDITAIAVIDEKVIVFKQRRIYAFAGDGPTATGDNDTFSFADLINTDVGCSNSSSIVISADGILFKSQKGIYLLNRSLDVQYVGADVEDYNSENITSAVLMEDANEIRFTTESGRALVYNYYFKDERGIGQWSTWTNYTANDAVNWDGVYAHIKSTGRVRLEDSTTNLDVGDFVQLLIETSWIKLNGLQGFQRIRWLNLIGEYRSSHTLGVDIGYDYDESYIDALSFVTADSLSTETYGDDALYGDDAYGGSNDIIYQWRSRLPRQKCQAIRFRFSDAAGSGESYSINGLDLEVAVKKGTYKLREAKTI